MHRLGRFTALLHNQAAGFAAPAGFRVRKLDKVFYYADPSFPYVEPVVLFDDAHSSLFPATRRDVFRRVADRVQAALDELYAEKDGLRVTHNDLHQWNVKVYRDRVYALDFEDLAWGYPVQDIATTLYYFDTHDQYETLFRAYKRGYNSCSDWPERYPGQIDAFIAGRDLMLANYVVISDNPEYRAIVPSYLARLEKRLRKYLAQVHD
jgi:Ser/Thr protein kinase RdoA (MazF antagonist)